jgi:hypothetical protein
MIAFACIGPGERCCDRGGVFVMTATPRNRIASGCQISEAAFAAHRAIRAVVLHDEQIERRDAAVFGEADLRPSDHPRALTADVVLFLPADPHHHRHAGLLRQQRRDRHGDRAGTLAAESAAAVLAHEYDVRRIDAQPAGERIERADDALRRPVQIELAVLPVRHGAARLHRLVRRRLHDERFVDDERGLPEARIQIAECPGIGHGPHRQLAVLRAGEVGVGPFQDLHFRARLLWRRSRRRCRRHPHVAVRTRVRAGRPQALHGIDDEGQRFEIDDESFDGFRGRRFVHRGDRENRLALVQRLVRQHALAAAPTAHFRQVVGGQNRLHARHRERGARVDAAHARVRHRAQQQLGEEHAVGAVVLGVFRAAGYLRDEIRRRVVLADEFLVGHDTNYSGAGCRVPGAWCRVPGAGCLAPCRPRACRRRRAR